MSAPVRPVGRVLLPVALVIGSTLWLFRGTAADMVGIWIRSETFQHAFLVPPIALWLAWRQRAALAQAPVRPQSWMLLPLGAACLLWLLGELAAVAAATHFALVTMLVLAVPALFGWAVTRVLAFPLAFLYFAVPFGEFLVPTLIEGTADFTVAALRTSGIPVLREGHDFVIPTGHWSVVEACSGVRYLIASVMVGSLFAYLNFRSWRRRWLFVGVSILVPIVANWLRAYMIVMIGHLSGNKYAVGVDHLIYGWVFFGVVIALMFLIGARWSEPDDPPVPVEASSPSPVPASSGRPWTVAAAALVLLAGTQGVLARLQPLDPAPVPPLALALGSADGWWPVDGVALPFAPGFSNPNQQASAGFRRDAQPLWLWIGYYRHQGGDRKLVSSLNVAVAADDRRWAVADQGRATFGAPDEMTRVRTVTLRPAGGLDRSGERLRVWQLYWVGGVVTASDVQAKLLQAWHSLTGRGDDGAVLLLATPDGEGADSALAAFLTAQRGAITAALDRLHASRP